MTLSALTPRERQVARLVAVDCLSSKDVAMRLGVSYRTVECMRGHILSKLGLGNTVQLARLMSRESAMPVTDWASMHRAGY